MGKFIDVNLTMNKRNGQINLTLPKKKLSKKVFSDISKSRRIKICIEKIYQ